MSLCLPSLQAQASFTEGIVQQIADRISDFDPGRLPGIANAEAGDCRAVVSRSDPR